MKNFRILMPTGIIAPMAVSATAENWMVRDSRAFDPFFCQYQFMALAASASTYVKTSSSELTGSLLFQVSLVKGSDLIFLASLDVGCLLLLSVIIPHYDISDRKLPLSIFLPAGETALSRLARSRRTFRRVGKNVRALQPHLGHVDYRSYRALSI